jgi:hypothetical protein
MERPKNVPLKVNPVLSFPSQALGVALAVAVQLGLFLEANLMLVTLVLSVTTPHLVRNMCRQAISDLCTFGRIQKKIAG